MYKKYLTVFLVSLFVTQNIASASDSNERTYLIEMIVFERTTPQTGGDPEQWPKNIVLEYPENRKRLITPEEAEETGGNNAYIDNPENTSSRFIQTISEVSAKTLNPERKAIDRTRGLRTIFHEAWVQDLGKSDSAPALLIKGGNLFGDHHELEGNIKLSVSRYLHITTDLWLSSFVPNYGQIPEYWPRLPSQDTEELLQHQELQQDISDTNETIELNLSRFEQNQFDTNQSTDVALNAHPPIDDSPFLIKEIITLRQKRKMKSNELHYIDHPRMGLLVKITPYEESSSLQKPTLPQEPET